MRFTLVTLLCLFASAIASAEALSPSVTVGTLPESVQLQQSFELPLTLHWQGTADQLAVLSVDLGTASLKTGRIKHQVRESSNAVTYALLIETIPLESGPTELGPMTLKYQDQEGNLFELPIPGSFEIRVGKKTPLPAVIGLFALAALALGGFGWYRKRRVSNAPKEIENPAPSCEELLGQCQQALRDGEQLAQIYSVLRQLKGLLPSEHDPLPPKKELEAAEQRVRYGGLQPDRIQLQRWVRAVEVVLKSTDTSSKESGVA